MMKAFIFSLVLLCTTPVFAQEFLINTSDNSTTPVLNEELRKLRKNAEILSATVAQISNNTQLPTNASDGDVLYYNNTTWTNLTPPWLTAASFSNVVFEWHGMADGTVATGIYDKKTILAGNLTNESIAYEGLNASSGNFIALRTVVYKSPNLNNLTVWVYGNSTGGPGNWNCSYGTGARVNLAISDPTWTFQIKNTSSITNGSFTQVFVNMSNIAGDGDNYIYHIVGIATP